MVNNRSALLIYPVGQEHALERPRSPVGDQQLLATRARRSHALSPQPGGRQRHRPRGQGAIAGLDEALYATVKGLETWRNTPAIERCKLMRAAAALLR